MRSFVRAVVLGVLLAAALVVASPAGAADECDGLMVCVPVAGPWVVLPVSGAVPRPHVEYEVTCPRGHVAGGLDARLSDRAIDVGFLGALGSPVNPGITTSRSVVFLGSYVGATARSPSFRPFVGCMPAAGAGQRVTTSASAFRPGRPTTRRVKTVRVRPGSATVVASCQRGERLVGASHVLGFFTKSPPSSSLAGSVGTTLRVRGEQVVVDLRGDAEVGGVRAVVQVHAVCSSVR